MPRVGDNELKVEELAGTLGTQAEDEWESKVILNQFPGVPMHRFLFPWCV